MKFYCDSCNTKYSIADEKVRGKVLKVRCKSCEHIITVREARTPEAATGSTGATEKVPRANWYYAVNGVTSGPFDLDDAREKFATGEVGDEAYVWHDTFDSWKPVATVEIFTDALAKGQALKPRAKTLGFTGKLQAVSAPDGANRQKGGSVPRPSTSEASDSTPGSKEEPRDDVAATEPASSQSPQNQSPQTDVREDKLAALRAKLKARKKEEREPASLPERRPVSLKPEKKIETAGPVTPSTTPKKDFDADQTAISDDLDDLAGLAGPAAARPIASAKESSPADTAKTGEPRDSALEDSDRDTASALPAPSLPSTTSTSDIFEIPAPTDEDEPEAADDAVPFFPAAASSPAATEQSALTGSLLIQLDQIQKQGRGGKVIAIGAIALFLLLAGSVGVYIYMQPPMEESEFAAPQGPGSGEHRELNLRRYTDNDQRKILELGDEEIEEMEFAEEDVFAEEDTPSKTTKAAPAKVATRTESKTKAAAPDRPDKTDTAEEPAEKQTDDGVAMAAAQIKTTDDDGNISADATRRKAELFRSATSTKRAETAIARPQDSLAGRASSKKTLSREQALEGMKRVARSVSLCRERHMRRGGSFETQKVLVFVTVDGSGEVTKFKAEPTSLQNTEFGRCMNSHKGRWRFAAFGGEPQPIKRRFVIQ